jgi:predicted nucleic acid-binding protein
MFVLDACTALDWSLPGRATAVSERAAREARKGPVIVPGLWLIETQNAVLTMLRQKKLNLEDAWAIRVELSLLSKRIDATSTPEIVDQIWEIAARHMLTFYDAVYVELAARLDLPLASSDGAVQSAAKRMGLRLL